VAGFEHHAAFASAEHVFAVVEVEAAFGFTFCGGVAFEAVLGKEWADFVFKEGDLLG
jgi:hypothetical protein